jgi:peptidoglycan hydrolase-like protein with peptidoglycan-binding domain
MTNLLMRDARGADVTRLRKALLAVLGDDAADIPGLRGAGDVFDADVEAAVRRWQAGVGLIADGIVGPHCMTALGLVKPPAAAAFLGTNEVRTLFPATKPANVSRYLPYVLAALAANDIGDRPMVLAALGTIRAETEGFLPISEYRSQFNTAPGGAPFALYDDRADLGNGPGDGARYRGRGFVQLTGRDNYRRYGDKLGIPLLTAPDLANAPEIAALLLARFLANCAKPMREAIAAGNLRAARKLVNGGSHGLDRFRDVFARAAQLEAAHGEVAAASPAAGRRAGATARRGTKAAGAARAAKPAAAAPKRQTAQRPLTARRDPLDLRDRPYTPPPVSLPAEHPPQDHLTTYLPRYTKAGLILDQGQEGACTGFGLACVVNYMRWRREEMPARMTPVSARMLYNFARRYDEYEGEDYEGSSCRGALKGWFRHGVCLETDWPYRTDAAPQPKYGYATRATAHSLGVYYRVDPKTITDMQSAIHQVGAVFVSAFTHDGWNDIPNSRKPPKNHAALPVIEWDGRPSEDGGHAFALVGFNGTGFIVQNSWGAEWGAGGFAVLTYADWAANAMDAWVAALGVPGVVVGKTTSTTSERERAVGADRALWWNEATAYTHSIVTGNDGRVGRYLTEDEPARSLLHQAAGLPDRWFRANRSERKRLVIYAHGGLNAERDAISRARAMGRFFTGNDCYPLFLVWKTGLAESIGNIVSERFQRTPPRVAAGVGEWVSERIDLLIEKTIGRPLVRPVWSEMKENAQLTCDSGRGGDLLANALDKLAHTWGDAFELHLVGHSAGAIILGHLLALLAARGLNDHVRSIHLYAPACTVRFATQHYAIHDDLMQRLHLDVLADKVERDDHVIGIYRKSLLYLVSNALESDLRTPILGLEQVNNPEYRGWDGTSSTAETLGTWRTAAARAGLAKRTTVMTKEKVVQSLRPAKHIAASHGAFDNDIETIGRTLERIVGGKLKLGVDDLRGF